MNVSNTRRAAEGEESISVSPTDPRQILIGSNQFNPGPLPLDYPPVGLRGLFETALWHSADGGRSWRLIHLDRPGTPIAGEIVPFRLALPREFEGIGNVNTTDQHSVFDRQGRAYFETGEISSPYTGLDIVGYVWRSDNGGRTWGRPSIPFSMVRTGIQPDRPWLAIDRSGGVRDGTLYFTWQTAFYQGFLPEVYVRSSTDGGRTWDPRHRVDDGLQRTMFNPRSFPEVGPEGTLYVVYNRATLVTPLPVDPELTPISIVVARSTDGGKTFTRTTVDPHVARAESPDEALPEYSEMISAMAVDPVNPGRLAVAWPNESTKQSSRILMRYSTDGGLSWSGRIDVADDPASRPNQHDHITLTYLHDGRLVAVWRDRRCCGGGYDDRFEVFARAFEPDAHGRLTPGRTIRLTEAPQRPTTGQRGTAVGEYIDAAATPDSLLATWDEMRGGYSENVFRSLPLTMFGRPLAQACATPTGRVRGRRLGAAALGRTRAANRRRFGRFTRRGPFDRFCLTDGGAVRVGYPVRRLLRTLARRERRRVRGRAVLALTTSPHYTIRGVPPGAPERRLRARLRRARRIEVGRKRWYVQGGSRSLLVARVRDRRVVEVGVADLGVAQGRRGARRLLAALRA